MDTFEVIRLVVAMIVAILTAVGIAGAWLRWTIGQRDQRIKGLEDRHSDLQLKVTENYVPYPHFDKELQRMEARFESQVTHMQSETTRMFRDLDKKLDKNFERIYDKLDNKLDRREANNGGNGSND